MEDTVSEQACSLMANVAVLFDLYETDIVVIDQEDAEASAENWYSMPAAAQD